MKVKVQKTVVLIMDYIVDAVSLPDAIKKVRAMKKPKWKNIRRLSSDGWSAEV